MKSRTICECLLGALRGASSPADAIVFLGAALAFVLWTPCAGAADQAPNRELALGHVSVEPRRVALSSIQAFDAGGDVLVRWETSLEMGVLGFNLFRETGGQWVKINAGIVPAQDAMTGGRYHQLDRTVSAPGSHRYRLEALLDTARTVDVETVTLEAAERVEGREFAPQLSQPKAGPAARVPAEPEARDRVRLASSLPVNLADPACNASIKIVTPKPSGMCFVSAAGIAEAVGQPAAVVESWITNGDLALFESDNQQQVNYIPGNGFLNSANPTAPGFFFYAQEHVDNYTYDNVYWFRASLNAYATVDNGTPAVAPATDYYWAVFESEDDRFSIAASVFDEEADFWMTASVLSGSSSDIWTSDAFVLHGVVKTGDLVGTLKLRVHGGSETPHRFEVRVNGTVVGEGSFSGRVPAEFTFQVPSGLLLDRLVDTTSYNNRITVQETSSPTISRVYIDGFALTYPKNYYSAAGFLEAPANGHDNISASAFYSYPPTVYEVTDPRNIKLLTNVHHERTSTTTPYTTTFRTSEAARYMILQQRYSALRVPRPPFSVPRSLTVIRSANLTDPATRASYLIITVPSLVPAAEAMADYRQSAFRTKIVLLDDIYNAFSHGLATPHAIAGFLRVAHQTWAVPPRYVLLLGDGTYDYRNLMGYGDNLVPPMMLTTDFGLSATDSRYGDVLSDGAPRVFVGRIPVASPTEFDAVLGKIRDYESSAISPPLRALLAADRPDAAGDFVAGMTDMGRIIAPAYDTNWMYYPAPYPVGLNPPPVDPEPVRAGIRNALDAGVDILEYVGHGSRSQLGTGGYLTVSDVAGFEPNDRLPIMIVMTCVAGDFSTPNLQSLVEVMLNTAGKGAVAAVAPTGLSYDADAEWINRRLLQGLTGNTSSRLGDYIIQSFALYNQGPRRSTPVWMYNMIGDPALKVRTAAP